jgi:hypothetical protein
VKVYLAVQPPTLSRGIHRVAQGLSRYAPLGVQLTTKRDEADLIVLHAIGFPEMERWSREIREAGKEYVVAQYCLRSSQKPSCADWLPIWQGARLVWSYYDLPAACAEDGVEADFSFYLSPLGVNGEVFKPTGDAKRFLIGTSGYVAETESVDCCAEAVRALGGEQFHLGPRLPCFESNVVAGVGLTDQALAEKWSACRYVSGLRRIEGFELPALEGLVCGARPLLFDRPHYRRWFGGHAHFFPEVDPKELTELLIETLSSADPWPVTDQERTAIVRRFDWREIVGGFWDRILGEERAVA